MNHSIFYQIVTLGVHNKC